MPNIITHDLFCEKVYNALSENKQLIKSHYKEFRIGSNGPDFLFFHHLFKEQKSSISTIGNTLHETCINEFYDNAISACQMANEDIKDKMSVYLIGHYLHWQLDSMMHPYVVYRTGFKDKVSTYCHYRFESMMDAMFLKHYKHQTIKDIKTYSICDHDALTIEAISNIYIPCVKSCLNEEISPVDIKQSLADWQQVQKLVYDPYMLKYKCLKIYETIAKKPWYRSGNIVPCKIDTTYDVLNIKRKEWAHPCSGETSTLSAISILENAQALAIARIPLLLDAIQNDNRSPFLEVLENKTYSYGIAPGNEPIYENNIYINKSAC